MRIRKLRLTGFKSFVEPAELRIEPGLTGIVGPNGCGKSNLLEAIRWVMGESSARSMRGAGMEDVIFAGTAARPPRDFAEVSILTERSEPDRDGDTEAEIVRRIERGAGSAYRLNGRDVRAKDVSLLFADAATGAHSPALVSQGKIAAVIAAKPNERRQMLEEAAGIAGLHVRRKDAEQKLRAAETNLTRLDELLSDMEMRANALRRQARAAERYRMLSDEIRTSEARLIFARWRDAASAADAARKEAEAAEQLVQTAAEAQRASAAHHSEATTKLAEARSAAQTAREAEADIGHRLAALKAEREAVGRRIIELAERVRTLASDKAREDQLAIDAANALEALDAESKALAASIAGAEAGRGESEARVAEAAEAVRQAELEMANALAAQAAEQAEVRVAQASMASASQRLQRAHAEKTRLENDMLALGDNAANEEALSTARDLRATSDQAITQTRTALAEAETLREAAAAGREEAESRGSAARARLSALSSEAKALASANQSGGDRVLTKMQAAPGYERALAAALGEDLDAALGGAGNRGWHGAEPRPEDPTLPAGVEALSDYVQAPPELLRRLAQIGVVDADDGGIVLAVGQRLVTRDGKMRRWDGYAEREAGAAAAERLIRANRLVEIEAQLPDAQSDVERAQAQLAKAQTEAQTAREEIDKARKALTDLEAANRRAMREEDAANAAIERNRLARSALTERQTRATAEYREAEMEAAAARAAYGALPAGDATQGKVAALQASGDTARSRLAEVRATAATLNQSITRDRQRRESAMAEARNWRSRAGDAAQRIEEMDTRAKQAEVEASGLANRPGELDALILMVSQNAEATAEKAIRTREAEKAAETTLQQAEAAAQNCGEAVITAREARAGATARLENQEQRRVEMGRISGERFECPAPVLPTKVGFDIDDVGESASESARLEKLMQDRERIGPVNLVAESELRELEESRTTNQAEREELGHAIHRLRGSIGSLNREGRARLMAAFEAVDKHFRRLFTTLFAGGEAHLALIDSDDPLEAGLEILAQPPGKKLAALTLLSGGEQALTAVALIFALFLTNPAPICVLDEVDAPLDDANIERFCDLLDRMTQETDTRYLIVTHNAVTMARMHRLFGVTMVERGVSRLVSVDLGGAETLLAAAE